MFRQEALCVDCGIEMVLTTTPDDEWDYVPADGSPKIVTDFDDGLKSVYALLKEMSDAILAGEASTNDAAFYSDLSATVSLNYGPMPEGYSRTPGLHAHKAEFVTETPWEVPWHCDEPMRLRPSGWHCRHYDVTWVPEGRGKNKTHRPEFFECDHVEPLDLWTRAG